MKQELDTNWQKSFTAITNAFLQYIISNKEEITEWKGQGDAAAFFATQLGKSEKEFRGGSPAAAADPAAEQKKAQANLFAEIQQKALSSQDGFKHVEKNAHKKNPDQAPTPIQPPAPKLASAPTIKKEEVKKPPKK